MGQQCIKVLRGPQPSCRQGWGWRHQFGHGMWARTTSNRYRQLLNVVDGGQLCTSEAEPFRPHNVPQGWQGRDTRESATGSRAVLSGQTVWLADLLDVGLPDAALTAGQ